MTKKQLIGALTVFATALEDDADRQPNNPAVGEVLRQNAAHLKNLIVQANRPNTTNPRRNMGYVKKEGSVTRG